MLKPLLRNGCELGMSRPFYVDKKRSVRTLGGPFDIGTVQENAMSGVNEIFDLAAMLYGGIPETAEQMYEAKFNCYWEPRFTRQSLQEPAQRLSDVDVADGDLYICTISVDEEGNFVLSDEPKA